MSDDQKIDLVPDKITRGDRNDCRSVRRSLPFFQPHRGRFVHRIRSGVQYSRDGAYSHTAFRYLCGNVGIVSAEKAGRLFAQPPEGAELCGSCELKARRAGR